jgi:hypothetical protein
MRVKARAAVVSEKQKQKKSDAAAAAADPIPLKNGGHKADKERSRAPRRGSIGPPPKRRRLSSSLAASADAEAEGTAAVVAAAAAVASAVAATDMGQFQRCSLLGRGAKRKSTRLASSSLLDRVDPDRLYRKSLRTRAKIPRDRTCAACHTARQVPANLVCYGRCGLFSSRILLMRLARDIP